MAKRKKKTTEPGVAEEYSTMIPVLDAILKVGITAEVKALEFGCGYFSTAFLIEHCKSVLSIERNPAWFDEIKDIHSDAENFDILLVDNALLSGAFFPDYDLVLVDGDTEDRVPVTNAALRENVPIVVVHDTDKVGWYGFHRLAPGPNYVRFDYIEEKTRKQTSVFAHFLIADRIGKIKPEGHKRA